MKISKESIMSWSAPKWVVSSGHSGCTGRKWTTLSIRCHRISFAQILIIGYRVWTTRPPAPRWVYQLNKVEARHRCSNYAKQNRSVWAYSHRTRWVSHLSIICCWFLAVVASLLTLDAAEKTNKSTYKFISIDFIRAQWKVFHLLYIIWIWTWAVKPIGFSSSETIAARKALIIL